MSLVFSIVALAVSAVAISIAIGTSLKLANYMEDLERDSYGN